jgi:hypothetical protein
MTKQDIIDQIKEIVVDQCELIQIKGNGSRPSAP